MQNISFSSLTTLFNIKKRLFEMSKIENNAYETMNNWGKYLEKYEKHLFTDNVINSCIIYKNLLPNYNKASSGK